MQQQPDYSSDFYENGIFHVYNRTNNRELLFRSDDNYLYFLKQYDKYLHPFVDTYCWNLMPNHFHFLVRVKPLETIRNYLTSQPLVTLKKVEKEYLTGDAGASVLLELEWKRFFNSYAMAFNKQHCRKGNLFHRSFKRVEITKDEQFSQAIIYIHANAQHHKLHNDFTQHRWSSWHPMLSLSPTKLLREEVLEWFGGPERFITLHKEMTSYYYGSDIENEE